MKELADIVKAYHLALKEGKKMALATVVKVEGSSYRRPGARMLVTDDGKLTGAISGGCLEGDALRKALLAINQQENKLVTYDTTDEDDAKFGVQLGCNGIVHILFEPIDIQDERHPIALLEEVLRKREGSVLITLFSLEHEQSEYTGTKLAFFNHTIHHSSSDLPIARELISSAERALATKSSCFEDYPFGDISVTAFVEYLQPPISLVIAGAGNDAIPLVKMANILGWKVTVVDGRATHASADRFGDADDVYVLRSQEVLSKVKIDEQTAFVLMTHNYNYDLDLLEQLLGDTNCRYIGTLGPKTKLQRMLDEMGDKGVLVEERRKDCLYGPVGLDLGAETAEEIALSITAEIKKVMSGHSGDSLRRKSEPIHHKGGQNVVLQS